MRFVRPLLLLLLWGVAWQGAARAEGDPKDSYEWWKQYAVKGEPLVAGAERVFARVLAAADKSEARLPRLLVIDGAKDTYAAALPDGTIVLSLDGIRACRAGVDQGKGDARLAFILGHELSHLSKNDFWHLRAYRAVLEFASGGKDEIGSVARFLEQASDVKQGHNLEVTKVKELQADSYGIVFMAMAGYDPHAVVDRDGTNFFRDYLAQIAAQLPSKDDEHPTAEQRAEFLKSQLLQVADEVELFHIGVRFYQQGGYDEAITYFTQFRELFPARELFNDIGLCYYQQALERLSRCDASLPYRFKLPALLDTVTLAQATVTTVTRGGKGERGENVICQEDGEFRADIDQAVRHLELARERDPSYLPARLNLASAAIVAGDNAKALAAVEEALRLQPGKPEALAVKAVALYLFGAANGVDTVQPARSILTGLTASPAPLPDAFYNLAALERERGKADLVPAYLERFLALEGTGGYAAAARRQLGRQPQPRPAPRTEQPKSPIALGQLRVAAGQTLAGMNRREFVIGNDDWALYRGKGMLALVRIDRASGFQTVEMVEVAQAKPVSAELFRAAQGAPRRELAGNSGTVLVYDGFLADVEGGEIRNLTFFNRNGI
ncbi:M48 family metalloprotease [Geomonas paludis]|uniref:M48 family metalloprotease n=1 Tax=Geomonas paludis TaxID=2740185 RepID=A0A6V8MTF4_9BACT|nr:M48 family metalloprotease [Geomonas paludis]UPU38207.1 M48 family metalloprotease [Geomonas paludis]GFO63261.1 hypothetical protein GMPD_11800 [Geomonas paludis]